MDHALFDREQFGGDCRIITHPSAGLLPFVLAYRRGLPVVLCLVYYVLARRLGLRCRGVSLPGHFLVRVGNGRGMLIDPFSGGQSVTAEEAVAQCRERHGTGLHTGAAGGSDLRLAGLGRAQADTCGAGIGRRQDECDIRPS